MMAASYAIDYFAAKGTKVAPIDKGRFDDLRVTGSDYGATIPIVIGRMRLAPQIVWHKPIRTVTTTSPGQAGGKGAPHPPSPGTVNYQYFTSLMMMVCQGPLANGIRRIWAGTKLIWNLPGADGAFGHYEAEAPENTLTNASLTTSTDFSGGQGVELNTSTGAVQFNAVVGFGSATEFGFAYIASGTRNITIHVNGTLVKTITVPGNNGALSWYTASDIDIPEGSNNTVKITNTSSSGGALLYVDRLQTSEEAIGSPDPVPTGLIDPANPLVDDDPETPFRNYNFAPAANASGTVSATVAAGGNARVRTYPGTQTQEIDALISSELGAGAQAYRNRACFMLEEYEIEGGNTNFQSFFLAEVDEGTRTVDVAVEKLFALVGTAASKLDVTGLSSLQFKGCVINSRAEARGVLDALQIAYNFDFVEADGKLRAVVRGSGPVVTIPQAELRARDVGAQAAAGVVAITRVEERTVPRAVSVNFIDQTNKYQNGARQAQRSVGLTQDLDTVSLPVVLAPDEAQAIASRLLYSRHLERKRFEWATTWKYLHLTPTDIVDLQTPEGTHRVRITEVQASLLGVVKFKGVQHAASVYAQPRGGVARGGEELPIVETPANTFVAFLDIPPLRPEDAEVGYYVAVCKRKSGRWDGAVLYKEDPSGDLQHVISFDSQATMGKALTALKSEGAPSVFDPTATFDVGLYSGELSSIDELTANATTQNLFALGDTDKTELAQFLTATPITTVYPYAACYRLSNIRRYMLGTDYLAGRRSTLVCHWANKSGVTEAADGTLSKTGATAAWDSGASCSERFRASESVTVEWTLADVAAAARMFGLALDSDADTATLSELFYSWYVYQTTATVYESGSSTGVTATVAAGDRLSVRLNRDGSVEYLKNDVSVATSSRRTSAETLWRPDCSLFTQNATVKLPRLLFPTNYDTRARREVSWDSLTNCESRDGGLIKLRGASGSYDAGASSVEVISDGGGYVEWTVPSTGAAFAVGLSDADASTALSDIRFAIVLNGSAQAAAYIDGTLQATPGLWSVAAGDKLKVACEEGVIRFYHNEQLKLQTATSFTYPLRVDASLSTSALATGAILFQREGHYAGELFVLMDGAVKFRKEDATEVGAPRNYRAATVGQDATTTEERVFRLTGNTIKPFPVTDVGGVRNDASDLFVSFRPRAWHWGVLPNVNTPEQKFWVEVLDSVSNVVRRIPVARASYVPAVFDRFTGTTSPGSGGTRTANTVRGPQYAGSPSSAVVAVSQQQVTAEGDWLEFAPAFGAVSGFGGTVDNGMLIELVQAANPYAAADYYLQISTYNNTLKAGSYRPGTGFVQEFSGDSSTFFNGPRVRVLLTSTGVQFFKDYSTTATAPFHTSPRQPTGPYLLRVTVYDAGGTLSNPQWYEVQNMNIGDQNYGVVYTSALQTLDFGSNQSAVKVRIFQEAPIVGRGHEVEHTL
jgi:hypothetical protein